MLYLITLSSCTLFVLSYLSLGLHLLQLSDCPSVFVLLKEPLISQTYVSYIILDTIPLVSFSPTKAITVLLKELRPFEVVMALLFLLVFLVVEKKRSTTVVLSAVLLVVGGIFFCTWQGFSNMSLVWAVVYIRYIGRISYVLGGVLLCFLFYYTCRQLESYYLALQIRIEELKEQETGDSS